MNPKNPSPRDELSEPLRSLIDDLASVPVPEDLIRNAGRYAGRVARPDQRDGRGSISLHAPRCAQRRAIQAVSAVIVSLFALGLCLMALIVRDNSPEPIRQLAKVSQPAAPKALEELPPPSLWAYRQAAHSPEALDALLTQHALVLLPSGPEVSLHPFSRKEEL